MAALRSQEIDFLISLATDPSKNTLRDQYLEELSPNLIAVAQELAEIYIQKDKKKE